MYSLCVSLLVSLQVFFGLLSLLVNFCHLCCTFVYIHKDIQILYIHTHSTLHSIRICDADIPFFLLSALTSCLHSFYITYDSPALRISEYVFWVHNKLLVSRRKCSGIVWLFISIMMCFSILERYHMATLTRLQSWESQMSLFLSHTHLSRKLSPLP